MYYKCSSELKGIFRVEINGGIYRKSVMKCNSEVKIGSTQAGPEQEK